MKCENCHEKEATVFYEISHNGTKKSMHLCPDCAAAMSKELNANSFMNPFGLFASDDLFGHFFGLPMGEPVQSDHKECPSCHATWEDITREGKLFCPNCYRTFADELESTLRSVHGNVTHTGRIPSGRRAAVEKKDKIKALRKRLNEAIKEENFEEAAKLRDEIRGLDD